MFTASDIKKKSGFTLVELLVVISIIAVLSSIILASLQSVRNQAGTAAASAELREMKSALELYYDSNGDWPSPTGAPGGIGETDTSDPGAWNAFMSQLVPKYLSSIPYPSYPSIVDGSGDEGNELDQGYVYVKGSATSPFKEPIADGAHNNAYLGCLIIYDGYFLDFLAPPPQSSVTRNDGGVDPDGIDAEEGSTTWNTPTAVPLGSCHN